MRYLCATDVYVTPYLSKDQICSGTLAYALGCGKATLSTPYLYAEEVLADGRGILIDFESPDSIADTVIRVLDDKELKESLESAAYRYGRRAAWFNVAISYLDLFDRVLQALGSGQGGTGIAPAHQKEKKHIYPPIVFEHLETLTDSTGVIQHAIFSIPNRRTGYTTDDNARALIAAIMEFERTGSRQALRLVSTYLSFLHYAQTPSGRFHNFMSYDQVWLDDMGSDDCFGRVMWACGYALHADLHPNVKKVAKQLFDAGLRWIPFTQSLRARAYMVLGCYHLSALRAR